MSAGGAPIAHLEVGATDAMRHAVGSAAQKSQKSPEKTQPGLTAQAPIEERLKAMKGLKIAVSGAGAVADNVIVRPERFPKDPAQTRLIAAFDEILTDLTSSKGLRYLARRVLPGQARRINDLGEPAIELTREAERLYPNINLAAQALGYTDDDGHGLIGVEKAFDQRLADPVQRATPLALSIDVRVQQAMQNELAALVADQNAKGAAGVVMDVNTGEVLAMVSLPDFNPNVPGQRADGTKYTTQNDDGSRFNRVTLGGYELGSTFKAFTIAMEKLAQP